MQTKTNKTFGYQKLAAIFMIFFVVSARAEAASTAIVSAPLNNLNSAYKSYREWKNSKVAEIENRIEILRDRMVKTAVQRNPSKDNQAEIKAKTEAGLQENLQDQLDQELLNLSVTRDLSISDYFVGYLNKQPSLERAIEEVSVRLTAEEVEELMQALALQLSLPKPNGARQAPRGDLMTK